MKPLILLTFSILLLSSCTQYRYYVTYEKCNGQTGSINYISDTEPYIETYKRAVPILVTNGYIERTGMLNVCYFSYRRNPIE